MSNELIDLRSDTVTKPCLAMRKVMSEAEVGDSFYGDDNTTKELEEYCANLFGTQSALFMISGTMANQVAIRCHIQAGEEIITDNYYHISYYEASATADLGKAVMNILYTDDGIITPKHLEFALMNRSRSKITAAPKLIWLENTINHYCGKIYPIDELKNIYNFAKTHNLYIHIDGARLLNACVADGSPFDSFATVSNSMIFSFSKALGAPAGAVLLGNNEFIEKARIYQKWYGGGMHQSGILAAAAKYAISNNIKYLNLDHDHAKLLAKILSQEEKLTIQIDAVMTNIVMFSVKKMQISAKDFTEIMRKYGVLLYPWSEYMVRAVMHKDISKPLVMKAAELILKVVQGKIT